MISSGEPFLLSKVIWGRICHITTLLEVVSRIPDNLSYLQGLEIFVCKWLARSPFLPQLAGRKYAFEKNSNFKSDPKFT